MKKIEFDIQDPSHSIDADYWQCSVAQKSENKNDWGKIQGCINRELPHKRVEFGQAVLPEKKLEFWGCIKYNQKLWLYRHFITGKDNKGRPGRYFFVVFRLEPSFTRDKETLNFVSKILSKLSSKISIPLDLNDLENNEALNISENIPDEICHKIAKLETAENMHVAWVVEKDSNFTNYFNLSTPVSPQTFNSADKKTNSPIEKINTVKNTFESAPKVPITSVPPRYIELKENTPNGAKKKSSNYDIVQLLIYMLKKYWPFEKKRTILGIMFTIIFLVVVANNNIREKKIEGLKEENKGLKEEANIREKKIEELKEENKGLKEEANRRKDEIKGLKEEANIREKKIEELKDENKGLKEEANRRKDENKGLKEEANIRKDEIKGLKEEVNRRDDRIKGLEQEIKRLVEPYKKESKNNEKPEPEVKKPKDPGKK